MGFIDQPAYLTKYGLKEAPYSTKPNERFLYLTPSHQEALAMVAKTIRDKEGAALIYGKFGTGKTTLMRRVFAELRDETQFRVAVIENAGHCPTEFQLAGRILDEFGEKSHHSHRKGRFDQIKEILLNDFRQSKTTVLLIDEAQEFPAHVLESLRGYLNFETGEQKILQIILFALPNIIRKLAYAATLRNRLWRVQLSEMQRNELAEMLRWRFVQAGGRAFPFEESAIDTLFTLTHGHPRNTCGLAQIALEVAALRDGQVTSEIIEQVKTSRFLED
jgi:general secretion pathway protein A